MKKTLSLFLAAALAAGMLSGLLLLAPPAVRAAVPINRNLIKNVIYPTLGYPAIVRCGRTLTIEFDPRDQDWSQALPHLTDFEVSVTTTNSAYPLTSTLPVEEYTVGFSTHWPEYSQSANPRAQVYLVTVNVPEAVPLHLHDLTVSALMPGGGITDSQPHAIQTVEQYKDDFTFAQLTDIHVWGPEAAYPGSYSAHERNYRHQNYSEADGYGATYYHKAIGQMNRAEPDFLVYTGDFDFSQKWLYKQNYADFNAYKNSPWNGKYYEPWFEMDWFYAETLKLNVPVFMVLGNHDSYARYDLFNLNLEEDYMASWRNLFGPQYYSFDYGPDYHFTSVNTMDWTSGQRNLHWGIPNVILVPGKWQGQVGAGGDPFQAGWSQAREDAINEDNFTNQLLWAKQDLQAHPAVKMRTMLMHCDPWKLNGSGSMFDDATMFGLIPMGGKGAGRLALVKLARENNVAIVLSGHDHSDSYGSIPWELGGGTVQFVNTTSTMFQDGDGQDMWFYPGYRFVHVNDGDVVNFYYELDGDEGGNPLQWSWPFYKGTVVGGPNNFANLVDPAIGTAWNPQPGTAETVECTITNNLTGYQVAPGDWSGDLDGAFMEFPMPYLTGGYYYTVTNGTFGEVFDNAAPDHRTYAVTTDVDHAPNESTPTVETVTVAKSAMPDTDQPTCATFQIDGGAGSTSDVDVTLTNDAVDPGGSGLLDMKIWNDGSSEASAVWQRYEASTSWELRHLAGLRTVNIRFRDRAMPGNVSDVYQASITLVGSAPAITGVTPGAARVGEQVVIDGTDFGAPQTPEDRVTFNGISAGIVDWTDTRITCVVPLGACTGEVTVVTDAGSASAEFHVIPVIDSIDPDYGYNTGSVHIDNLEGTGFYESGTFPDVKLTNGTDDIFATNVQVVSPQSITCDFDLTGATVGWYNVVVQNEDGYGDTLEGGFKVDWPPPTVTGIAPDSGVNVGTIDITDLAGTEFRAGMRAWLIRGATEVEATSVVVGSATHATCTFDLTGLEAGKWDVYVQNDDGEGGTLAEGFTVENPAPTVTGINPSSGFVGDVVDITNLAGTAFRAGATVKLTRTGHADIAATNVNVVSGTQITCRFDLTGAATGQWNVVVTNDDSKSGTLAGGFEVRWSSAHIDSLSASTGKPGDVLTITGSNFGSPQGGSYVAFGGVRATSYSQWTGGQVKVAVPPGVGGDCQVTVHSTQWGVSNAVPFEVRQPAWYLAEGSTAWGFDTYVSIENPNNESVTVDVTYMTPTGAVDGGAFGIKSESQMQINPGAVLPSSDFSTKVECREGLDISVDRTMSWNGGIEGHNSIGVNSPQNAWYFPEGCSAFGFETWLLIQNPNPADASCQVTYMIEGAAPVTLTKVVPANSRASYGMADDIGAQNASILVESDLPVIPERSMYRDARREGHDSIGATAPATDFYLAEGSTNWGFTTYVLVQNPNAADAQVTLTYMTPEGPLPQAPFTMPANSRQTVEVNAAVPGRDLSTLVHADVPIVAERAMYWDNGTGQACHDSIGIARPHMEFFLPDGQTSDGVETWTLVQNPNDVPVKVEVTYMTDDGSGNRVTDATVPANSRVTFNMASLVDNSRAAVRVVSKTAGKPIIVERSMYWNNRGAGTDTIGSFAD
ncbi:MAG: IPT/TIG domain-containing protein [Actinobacteria bacterium]|nr:IPT/TIG domain-containing protein [Actinomycetota bacterium]MBU1944526.1 IPT/TIG domain-containing protein [Actinomycetota bacterium]MBU2689079.1 IPT/TIG domain-containing protein [Actinomycetota bacterium]